MTFKLTEKNCIKLLFEWKILKVCCELSVHAGVILGDFLSYNNVVHNGYRPGTGRIIVVSNNDDSVHIPRFTFSFLNLSDVSFGYFAKQLSLRLT